MDASWGTTGLDFNYDSSQGLEEALADPERLDETLLDRIMIRHTDKLTILPAAASLGTPAPTAASAYEALVDGVRSISPLTILDMPHIWSDWSSQLLTTADEVVITATLDLANLRNTKNLVDFLKAARPNDAEPLLILNKTGVPKTAEIPVKDFAAAVGIQPAVVLAYEPVVYTEASNDGKMLSELKSAEAAYEGLTYLAHRLQMGEFPAQTTGKKGKKLSLSRKKSAKKDESSDNGSSKKSLFAKLKKRK
jgi:pilus assembly protein CpaE